MLLKRFALALSFFHIGVSASPEPALTLVDVDSTFPAMTQERALFGGFYDGVIPNLETEITQFVELQDFYLFYAYANGAGSEPHILYKATGQISLFKDLDGTPSRKEFDVGRGSIYPLNGNSFILRDSRNDTDWFISDGTEAGTVAWESPVFGTTHIAALENDDLLIFDVGAAYRYNPTTETLTEVFEHNRVDHLTKVGRYFVIKEQFPDQANTLVLTDGTANGTSVITYDTIVNQSFYSLGETIFFQGAAYALVQDVESGKVISILDPVDGLTQLVSFADFPECGGSQVIDYDERQVLVNNGDHWAFGVTAANGENCLVNYNALTAQIDLMAESLSGLKDLDLLGVNANTVYATADFSTSFNQKLVRILEIDFTTQTYEILIEPSGGNSDVEILAASSDFLFGYYNESCDNECQSNVLFRIDVNSGEFVDYGSRLGHTDSRSDVRNWGAYRQRIILNSEMFFTGSMPYPGIFRTNTATNNFQLVGFPAIETDTESNAARLAQPIYSFSFGWLTLRERAGDQLPIAAEISNSGVLSTTEFERNFFTFASRLGSAEWDGKAYLFGPELYEYDPIAKSFTSILNSSNSSVSELLAVVNNVAYGRDINGGVLTFDIASGEERVVSEMFLSDILMCGEQAIGFNDSGIDNAPRIDALYALSATAATEIDIANATSLRLSAESKEAGYLLLAEADDFQILDCSSLQLSDKISHSGVQIESFLTSVEYNRFDNSLYITYPTTPGDVAIDRLDLGDESLINVYQGAGGFTLSFSQNGIFGIGQPSTPFSNSIYKLVGGLFFELADVPAETGYRFSFNMWSVDDENGRYLIGSYRENGAPGSGNADFGDEPFIIDTLTESFHLLDLFPGRNSGLLSGWSTPNNGYVALNASTESITNEVMLVDLGCVASVVCKNQQLNRSPAFDNAIPLYYEAGDQVTLPFRAFDTDGDTLSYSIENGPSWLSISTQGVISGTVPESADQEYTFQVSVSDGQSSEVSDTYVLTIDSVPSEQEPEPDPAPTPSPTPTPAPTPTPSPSPGSSGDSGGGGALSLHLIMGLMLITVIRRRKVWTSR